MRLIIAIVLFLSLARPVSAEYVLPYPSYMPGNKLYRTSRLIDRIKQPFYFGNLSSFKYHLSLADKYLVEAKTLFEYKQYMLAQDALMRSDQEFTYVPFYLKRAKREGKDVSLLEQRLQEASVKHQEVLKALMTMLPNTFTWVPEKTESTILPIRQRLENSINIRSRL